MEILPVRYLDPLPLWLVLLLTAALFLLFSEVGFHIGRRWRGIQTKEAPQTGAIMGATLGLLGFMLAFTFGMAGSRFDERKALVVEEANALGTTWLRAQMLPAPHPEQVSALILRYVEIRIEGSEARDMEHLAQLLDDSVRLQNEMWKHALSLGKEYPRSVVLGLFINSLNDVIDLHENRLNVARYRIPRGVMTTLYFIAFIGTTLVGVNAGQSGNRSLLVTTLLALTLSSVMVLIVDLDRPGQTLFRVNQQSLLDLRDSIQSSPF